MLEHYAHQFLTPTSLVKSYLSSCSNGGFFIATNKPLALWTKLEFRFNLPTTAEFIECQAIVFWVNTPDCGDSAGMGLKITEINKKQKELLEDYLRRWGVEDHFMDSRLANLFNQDIDIS